MDFAKPSKLPGLLAEFKNERNRKLSSYIHNDELQKLELKPPKDSSSDSSNTSEDNISFISNSQK